jgi:hypothetical protein
MISMRLRNLAGGERAGWCEGSGRALQSDAPKHRQVIDTNIGPSSETGRQRERKKEREGQAHSRRRRVPVLSSSTREISSLSSSGVFCDPTSFLICPPKKKN